MLAIGMYHAYASVPPRPPDDCSLCFVSRSKLRSTKERYDDFNVGSAAWTLRAHEGRPGHALQFTIMVERDVSLARSMFAFDSFNVEGWALDWMP